jgi:hypothetical protein
MTSVAAEQFHREHDPLVHYGPVWRKHREPGESFAACDHEHDGRSRELTTHVPWVTCVACKEFLTSNGESPK